MVHNGVEYGMMQAYAEGFEILEKSQYGLDLQQVGKVWQHGSVVRSWLLDLAVRALEKDPKLEQLEGWVSDSGEGRWTIEAAIDEDVPAPVIAFALFSRFYSRDRELVQLAHAGRAAQRVRRARGTRRRPGDGRRSARAAAVLSVGGSAWRLMSPSPRGVATSSSRRSSARAAVRHGHLRRLG